MSNKKHRGCFFPYFDDVSDYQSVEREVRDREEVFDLERDNGDIYLLLTRMEQALKCEKNVLS